MRNAIHGLLMLSGLCLCLLSCGDDGTTKPADQIYLPRTTPENVLENLITATERRDFVAYRDQFDPAFQFHYRPWDIGTEEMPAAHDLSDELCLAKVMCFDARVDTLLVEMSWAHL
ncbi:MAG: hypothetical protein ABIH23_29765 [bacterium]